MTRCNILTRRCSGNEFGDRGATALATALRHNTALTHLDLTGEALLLLLLFFFFFFFFVCFSLSPRSPPSLSLLSLSRSLFLILALGNEIGPEGVLALARAIDDGAAIAELILDHFWPYVSLSQGLRCSPISLSPFSLRVPSFHHQQ